ncbi:GmrSD restriction endonuclease domain-containing protein [Thioclava pacifica]|uniref:DUF262 domain-containing protein n=1 Tax=Thioclava pacifica DSM 10166 TaxID=1353537 RepID=A0A074JDS3_9RHOB|nr:DUF262 domain-containing HNH endonuclease family protein [Thioclava pacifica]KEO54659.1 hypothetical protein TP2_17470 [Thioclava pacifica DSM 10166]
MKKVEDLFKARASSPLETAMLYDGRVGFSIPEYQRQYDWSEDNITRLYFDTLNGFQRLSESADANAFTFLGTLILVEEETKEEEFSGVSVAVVDGQQRLTTLTLFACALCEDLRRQLSELTSLSSIENSVKTWLEEEVETRLYALYECAIGSQRVSPKVTFPFPRIVRRGDARGRSKSSSDYQSPIGRFLEGFADYFDSDTIEYVPPALGAGTDAERLAKNFQLIRRLIGNLNDTGWYEDTECEQFDISWTRRTQCRNLFERLPDYLKDEGERNRAIESIIKTPELHALVRTLLFASYFSSCIVLTRVTTDDESAAFDIFDALNTTGEPLTALETLKPRVINFENKASGYGGSPSELAFEAIAENLDQRFSDTTKKQAETKDLIVTFALYLEGKKLSKDLAAQRNFLRQSYDGASKSGKDPARRFVQALADSAEFRRFYWERDGIEELGRFHKGETVDEVQLLTSLISDMKTSLAFPILSRYWNRGLKHGGEANFLEALRAIVAFLVLRRAATGGTAGIDSDFRDVMAPSLGRGASRKFGLCAGVGHDNPVLSPAELKEALKTLLNYKLKTLTKESWVGQAAANPLYQQSRELVRFMILVAANQGAPSTENAGTWIKQGVKASAHSNNFLDYKTWKSSDYATVEHVAPETVPKHGWDAGLYRDNILRHTLGNLVLLPAKENSAIGSDSWEKKKKFYLALTERSAPEQTKRIEEAKAAGISFSKTTEKLLQEGRRLDLLDPLRDVEKWNADVVSTRGKNIAELCWDHVWPWLN